MKRILIETQSNPMFLGDASEQSYDQRGGLCQVGEGHVIVVTNPFDPLYLQYWEGLGFTLPEIIHAGPFDPGKSLSELIVQKSAVQQKIITAVNGSDARLEFFWVEETEEVLARKLRIPPHCNIVLSKDLAHKHVFKGVCRDIDLPTAQWVFAESSETLLTVISQARENFDTSACLVKSSLGTGGVGCGQMQFVSFDSVQEQEINSRAETMFPPFVVEKTVDVVQEISVHWEIFRNGNHHIIGVFEQLSKNFSYAGTAFPSIVNDHILSQIMSDLEEKLIPYLLNRKGLGYFCCDVLIDRNGNVYWTDFNPRKGAIVYVHDFARRISETHFGGKEVSFWHEHTSLSEGSTFGEVYGMLREYLTPLDSQPFLVVTNPGVIPFGGLDITGISLQSREEARLLLKKVKSLLAS